MSKRIYLDHNASSPLRPEAREAMLRVMDMPGNPSSIHAEGRALKGEIERARASVAKLVGAPFERGYERNVYFTSGATEAANWALGDRPCGELAWTVCMTAAEHPCLLEACPPADETCMVPVLTDGTVDPDVWDETLNPHYRGYERATGCVTAVVQLANSETGVLHDVQHVADNVHWWQWTLVCDAVQGAGRIDLFERTRDAGIVFMSAHKIGGPRGVGAIIVRDDTNLPMPMLHRPMLRGGGQERNKRAGTENVVGIAGFGAAAEAALRDLDDMPRIRAMRDRLEDGLRDLSRRHGATLHIFGEGAERLPNTSCFAVEGVEAQTALMGLDLDGFAVSSGSACSSGKVGHSHVLAAMGVPDDVAACALRVSLGWTNEEDDIPAFLAAYDRIVSRVLARAA